MNKTLAASVLSIGLLAAPAAAQNVTYPLPQVVDATGKVVGYFAGPNVVVLYLPNGHLVSANFYKETGFFPPTDLGDKRSFYFTSSDCTGTKYLDAYGAPPFAAVDSNHHYLYYPDDIAQVMEFHSQHNVYEKRQGCTVTTHTVFAAVVKSIGIDARYAPPFSVKLN